MPIIQSHIEAEGSGVNKQLSLGERGGILLSGPYLLLTLTEHGCMAVVEPLMEPRTRR